MFIINILPLQETLSSVATWLESHKKEIVILACSHFEGIDNKLHESFIFSLKKLFHSKICPWKVSFHLVQLIFIKKQTHCLTKANLPLTGLSADLAKSVGIWSSGPAVL